MCNRSPKQQSKTECEQECLAVVESSFKTGYLLGKKESIGGCQTSFLRPGHGTLEAARREQPKIVHKRPGGEIIFDGVAAPAETIKEYDGSPLYYFSSKEDIDQKTVRVFSTMERLHQHRRDSVSKRHIEGSNLELVPSRSPFVGSVELY